MKHLEGKVAVITGSGQGIGKGIALFLASEGASVITNNRKPLNREKVEKEYAGLPEEERQKLMAMRGDAQTTAEEIQKAGGRAEAFFGDVSDYDTAKALIEKAIECYGRIDILVNNAAGLGQGTIVNTSEEDWDYMTKAKMKGAFNTMHHAVPYMIKQRSGHILNSASNAWVGISNLCAYSAGNAGIVGLTKAAAKELKQYHISVNAYCPRAASPGHIVEFKKTVDTLQAAVGKDNFDAEKMKEVEAEHQDPIYLAPFLGYLCTDEVSDITGNVFGLSASGKIEYYSESTIIDQVEHEKGQWTIDELKDRMPDSIINTCRKQQMSDDWENNTIINKDMPDLIFDKGVPVEGFYGDAYINMMLGFDHVSGSSIGTVTLAPGAHNNWHIHFGYQVLMVLEGCGLYQEKGKTPEVLHKGDVKIVEPGVQHWHGAAPDSWFSHIGIVLNEEKMDKHEKEKYDEVLSEEEYRKIAAQIN